MRAAPSAAISFRLDYRLNGRREAVYRGRYVRDGISLARARELCIDARRAIAEGRSPAIEKQPDTCRIKQAWSFGDDLRTAPRSWSGVWALFARRLQHGRV